MSDESLDTGVDEVHSYDDNVEGEFGDFFENSTDAGYDDNVELPQHLQQAPAPVDQPIGDQPATPQGQTVEPAPAPVSQTAQNEGISLPPVLQNAFIVDGKVDLGKAVEFFTKAKEMAAGTAQTVSTPAENDVVKDSAWREELKTYGDALTQNILGPIREMWDEALQSGEDPSSAYMQRLNAKFIRENQRIQDHLNEKRDELYDTHTRRVLDSERSKIEDRDTAVRAQAVQQTLEAEVGGREQYLALMFGYPDANGNLVQGPGAEIVTTMFEMQTGKSAEGATDAEYQSWWRKFSSNEANARKVLKLAKAQAVAQNLPALLSAAREEAVAKVNDRRQGGMRPPGGGNTYAEPAPIGGQQYNPAVARMAGINQPEIL